MVSSYGPPASHIIGSILRKKLPVYWVADYRDLWFGNYFYSGKWPFTCLEYLIEWFFVKKADFITTVSDPLKDKLTSLFGNKVATIENGFDEEDSDKIETTGIFPNDGKNPIGLHWQDLCGKAGLFATIESACYLKRTRHTFAGKIRGSLYGFLLEPVMNMAAKYHLENIIIMHGFVDRKTALQAQRDADALIFF